MYSALPDIEGKITSMSFLFSTGELPTNNVNDALKEEILQQHVRVGYRGRPQHNFVILAYYDFYRQNGRKVR